MTEDLPFGIRDVPEKPEEDVICLHCNNKMDVDLEGARCPRCGFTLEHSEYGLGTDSERGG